MPFSLECYVTYRRDTRAGCVVCPSRQACPGDRLPICGGRDLKRCAGGRVVRPNLVSAIMQTLSPQSGTHTTEGVTVTTRYDEQSLTVGRRGNLSAFTAGLRWMSDRASHHSSGRQLRTSITVVLGTFLRRQFLNENGFGKGAVDKATNGQGWKEKSHPRGINE